MIMKTSVLLSWEFPDNYDSPTPYKVRPQGGQWVSRQCGGVGFGCARGGVGAVFTGNRGSVWVQARFGIRAKTGLGCRAGAQLG